MEYTFSFDQIQKMLIGQWSLHQPRLVNNNSCLKLFDNGQWLFNEGHYNRDGQGHFLVKKEHNAITISGIEFLSQEPLELAAISENYILLKAHLEFYVLERKI